MSVTFRVALWGIILYCGVGMLLTNTVFAASSLRFENRCTQVLKAVDSSLNPKP